MGLIRNLFRFFSLWLDTYKKQGWFGKLILLGVSVLAVWFICSIPSRILSPDTTPTPEVPGGESIAPTDTPPPNTPAYAQQESSAPATAEQVASSPTDTPTATPLPPPTNTPTTTPLPPPTDTPEIAPGLPGLNRTDVTLNLEPQGFECSDAERYRDGFYWICSRQDVDYSFIVKVWSRKLMTVDTVEASALPVGDTFDPVLAADFLSFMATLPYDRSQPEQARKWVEENLPNLTNDEEVTTTIGGLNFRLSSGFLGSYYLTMGLMDYW